MQAIVLASRGHNIIGIEPSQWKIESLNKKKLYILEPDLDSLFQKTSNTFTWSGQADQALHSDISIINVGSPALSNGDVDLSQLEATSNQILKLLKPAGETYVVVRSTVPPGSTLRLFDKLRQNKNVHLIYYPEFLREGSAVQDFNDCPLHVFGCEEGFTVPEILQNIFQVKALKQTEITTAEMLKYLNNSFHALKVAYINEMASIASRFNVNVDHLVDLFLADTKLNISSKYLRPGFSFGGPCLSKELKALNHFAQTTHVKAPLIEAILPSNNNYTSKLIVYLQKQKNKKILFSGLTFKPHTNDLRDSPLFSVLQELTRQPSYTKKWDISVYENDHVKNELAHHKEIEFLTTISDLSKYDLVILGPLIINQQLIQDFKGQLIDLCYFSYPTNLNNLTKVYELKP